MYKEPIIVCCDCHSEVKETKLGRYSDESLAICDGCGNIEQETEEWTEEEFEANGNQ